MSMFRWLVGALLMGLWLVVMQFGGCVIADAGPCQTNDDCQKLNPPLFCARGWCVPKHIYDQVLAADEKKGSTEPGGEDGGQEPGSEPSVEPDASVETPPKEQPVDESSCQNQCTANKTARCYPVGTQGCDETKETCVGTCTLGEKSCTVDSSGCLVWGKCVGAGLPASEVCDGKDNDCNGKTDDIDSCKCVPGTSQACGSDVGECKKGTQSCDQQGQWGPCTGESKPSVEICDGKDNDCNGQVDEISDRACYSGPANTSGKGICLSGIEKCEGGKWSACQGEVKPANEACDGLDNDCDGDTDEGCTCQTGNTQACGSDVGECKKGTQTCDAKGAWGACTGATGPGTETCNNKDDNCDGSVDENLTQPCYSGPASTTGKGKCKSGTQTCSAGSWGTCTGEVKPDPKELCTNKIDDNCDGQIDEDCQWAAIVEPGSVSGSSINKNGHIGTDASENVYIAGNFRGSVKAGVYNETGAGGQNAFIAQVDKTGAFIWFKKLIGKTSATTNEIEIRDMATDSSGNVYITGWMRGSIQIGSNTYTINNSTGSFIAKFDSRGSRVWFLTFGGGNADVRCTTNAESLALDSKGNIYLTGYTAVSFTLGGKSVGLSYYCGTLTESFVVRLDASGKASFAVSNTSSKDGGVAYAHKISVDQAGNAYITGEIDSLTMIKFGQTSLTPKYGVASFAAKVNGMGAFEWAVVWQTDSDDIFSASIVAIPTGGCFLSFSADGANSEFNGTKFTASDVGALTIKLDANGKLVWSKAVDPSAALTVNGFALDTAGNPHVVGSFSNNVKFGGKTITATNNELFLFSANQQTGAATSFIASSSGSGKMFGNDVVFDQNGHRYVAGWSQGIAKLGSIQTRRVGGALVVFKNPE